MLDHAAGIDQIITPILVAVAVGIARSLQLCIGEEIGEIDLAGRDQVGVGVERYEAFSAPREEGENKKATNDRSNRHKIKIYNLC